MRGKMGDLGRRSRMDIMLSLQDYLRGCTIMVFSILGRCHGK